MDTGDNRVIIEVKSENLRLLRLLESTNIAIGAAMIMMDNAIRYGNGSLIGSAYNLLEDQYAKVCDVLVTMEDTIVDWRTEE